MCLLKDKNNNRNKYIHENDAINETRLNPFLIKDTNP